jgi:putative membrane protein
MRIPIIAASLALGLIACQKTAGTNDNEAIAYNDANMTADADMGSASAGIDGAFVTEAIRGDAGEVAIGKLAQTNGSSQKVKDFGTMLESDHGAHKDKLTAMATTAGLTVTDEPSAEAKANIAKLTALHGPAFDTAFKAAMIEDHEKDIAKYEKQAAGTDAQTAAMAKETLPTLRKHLDTAKAL